MVGIGLLRRCRCVAETVLSVCRVCTVNVYEQYKHEFRWMKSDCRVGNEEFGVEG